MDVLALLHQAKDAGLRLESAGDKLLVRGPKHAEPVVKLLPEHKAEVLGPLLPVPHPASAPMQSRRRARAPSLSLA
jgi:hypothetical protein